MQTTRGISLGGALLLALALTTARGWASESEPDTGPDNVLFRYTNAAGSLVVQQSIPPDAAARGYEIITSTGRVLNTVKASPKGADAVKAAEQMRREAELAEWDARLTRRYSTVKDIESAKQRNLTELRGNVSLLRGNLTGIKSQLEQQQRRAGSLERMNKPVSETLRSNIAALEAELIEVHKQIEQRRQALQEAADKFDRDIERLKEINR
jgi:chromosome segregation ATPase